MINNTNKNVSVWRGDNTPPTEYHVWIKSNGSVLINKDGTWFTLISESTNDSVNVCNLSDSHHLTLEEALDIVALYLGKDVFHAGYKIRFNVNTKFENPNVWKEYIFTAADGASSILYKVTKFWKLLATSDLFDANGEIRSQYLPSYVDDVLEFESIDLFPEEGESDKIYVDTSTNKSYRWSGTLYVLIALTDIVTSESDGLMSSEMYNKLEKTASDLDIHDRQNLVDFAEIRLSLGQKVGKIVDSQGNIISDNVSIATIPNATSLSAGLMTSDDKIKLDSIESEFVKDLGLVASTDVGDLMAAKSEIAGNTNISFIRYRTAGVRAEKVTTIFLWRNGINETAQIKFVDKAQWRRNVTGATGVAGAPTNAFQWERTGAHYLGYDAASRTLQLKDYNLTVFRTVLLPLALNDEDNADNSVAGLLSPEEKADIGKIITRASFNAPTGEIHLKNKANNQVTSLTIPPATKDGMGLMSANDVIEMGTLTEHRINRNNPHNVTKAQVGLGNVTNDAQVKRSEMGQPDGVALLNSDGKISSSYLPSYVSDVITANSYSTLPSTGEEDKIYVTKDTNLTYRWSGTAYVEISPSLALGETSTTAYAGDKGKNLSNSVYDLKFRVGGGWVVTDNMDFATIGTGDTRVEIVPGARILASVVGQGSSFTISSNTDTASIGYGASIGLNSVLGAGLSASINNVTGPDGSTRQGIVLKDVNGGNGIKILGRNNGEFLVSTGVNNNDWIDLARLDKISTMINVSSPSGLSIDPSILTTNSSDSEISIGTNTTIGSNVTIGSYTAIGDHSGIGPYFSVGRATSIGNQVNISDYVRVGTSVTESTSGDSAQIGTDIIISTGINITKNTATTTILNNNTSSKQGGKLQFGTGNIIWSGAEIGTGVHITEDLTADSTSYKLGETSLATIGKNVELLASLNTYYNGGYILSNPSMRVSTIGDNVLLGSDVTIKDGATIYGGVEIGSGVHITENLTFDSTSYKLGGTNLVIISKGINIYCSDTEHALKITAPTTDGGSLYSFGNVLLGTNFQVSPNVSLGISLGTGSIDAVSYYQLKDPKSLLLTSSIGAGVTILSGIQIKESDSGGIQIYVPSLAKWITIN